MLMDEGSLMYSLLQPQRVGAARLAHRRGQRRHVGLGRQRLVHRPRVEQLHQLLGARAAGEDDARADLRGPPQLVRRPPRHPLGHVHLLERVGAAQQHRRHVAAQQRRLQRRRALDRLDLNLLVALDTLLEAASGLRRELALPPGGELRPADTVAGSEPDAAPVGRTAPEDDPALFDELLALAFDGGFGEAPH